MWFKERLILLNLVSFLFCEVTYISPHIVLSHRLCRPQLLHSAFCITIVWSAHPSIDKKLDFVPPSSSRVLGTHMTTEHSRKVKDKAWPTSLDLRIRRSLMDMKGSLHVSSDPASRGQGDEDTSKQRWLIKVGKPSECEQRGWLEMWVGQSSL